MSSTSSTLRLLSLTATNIRGFCGEHTLELGRDLAVIIGGNGSGKSSILNAIEWCLFGESITMKSGSGMAERIDWILANYNSNEDVSVQLSLALRGETLNITRTRLSAAKSDDLRIELPQGESLVGDAAEAWMAQESFPDFKTWKRSYCQHQEQSRARITEAKDRSAGIAAMLGLDGYREVAATIKELKASKLKAHADDILSDISAEQERAAGRPLREVSDCETTLARLGIDLAQAGPSELAKQQSDLLTSARTIANTLGVDASAIPADDASTQAVMDWAPSWKALVQESSDAARRAAGDAEDQQRSLKAAMAGLSKARQASTDANETQKNLTTQHGSVETLQAALADLETKRSQCVEAAREADALGQLLRDAQAVVHGSATHGGHDAASCPVCGEASSDLAAALQSRIDASATNTHRSEAENLGPRIQAVRDQIQSLTSAASSQQGALATLATQEDSLRGLLPEGVQEGASLEDAKAALAATEASHRKAQEGAKVHQSEHATRIDRLAALDGLRTARAKVNETGGELTEEPAFHELQASIDAAAGIACDLDAIADMARALEDEHSTQQVDLVNDTIDQYFTMITGTSRIGGVRVKAHKTATKVDYKILDDGDRDITGTLNQAAFNALSIATLFASAETRACQGLPQFLLLDDPGQSLDSEHLTGLAKAIRMVSEHAQTIVLTYPGGLDAALTQSTSSTSSTTQVYNLGRNVQQNTTQFQEVTA